MIKHLPIITLLLLLSCSRKGLLLNSNDLGNNYFYEVNLNEVKDDRLAVKLTVFGIKTEEAMFHFPRIVPGIYGAMDFGRNVVHFQALAGADTLPVERMGTNSWKIRNAHKISEIRYEVNDGWEEFGNGVTEGFYRSAESSFSKNKVFVINNNTLFGYFAGGERWPVFVTVERPENFYAATSLTRRSQTPGKDEFSADTYRELVDNPILYARPDTVNLQIGNTLVTVACYADSGAKLAPDIARKIRPLMEHQREYLGGALPVDRYTFLFYHSLHNRKGEYTGDGLEHAASTLCLLNSTLDSSLLQGFVYGIASHEFFHILTPLTIHSEEIQEYDFLAPGMSQHLWLYEGMTEYFMLHMPVKQGLEPLEDFLSKVQRKAGDMMRFDNSIPLTELSRAAMERQDQYYNFYLKGALVNLCLDIRLRELSEGAYGTQELMRDLSRRYGKDKPFKDNELFDTIAAMTYPEIREFFQNYVEGTESLPLKPYLEKAGITFDEKKRTLRLLPEVTPRQLQLRKWWTGQ